MRLPCRVLPRFALAHSGESGLQYGPLLRRRLGMGSGTVDIRKHFTILAVVSMVVCWASVPLFLKHFTANLDAWTVNAVRYGVASVLLLPFAISCCRHPVAGRNIWRDALVPAAVNTLGQVGWALIPYYLDASVMGFGIRSSFLFAVMAGLWLLPEERALMRSPLYLSGAGICVTGMVMLFAGVTRAHGSVVGYVILLATSAVWGFYGVCVRKFMHGYSSRHAFSVICLYTAVILAVLMAACGHGQVLASCPPGLWLTLAVSAVIGIVVPHILMYTVVRRFGPLIEAGSELTTPFLTFAGAALLFGERLTSAQWVGGIGVICGSACMVLAHRDRQRNLPEPP